MTQMIFVFGSNLAGRHGAGAALCARNTHGAKYGVGVGRTGNAYAIPTKDERIRTLPLSRISEYVAEFLKYASDHPELDFQVTKIGCGLAGYREHEIAPMFRNAPKNCHLPDWWRSNEVGNKPTTAVSLSMGHAFGRSQTSLQRRTKPMPTDVHEQPPQPHEGRHV